MKTSRENVRRCVRVNCCISLCILACAERAKNEWDNEIAPGHVFGTRPR